MTNDEVEEVRLRYEALQALDEALARSYHIEEHCPEAFPMAAELYVAASTYLKGHGSKDRLGVAYAKLREWLQAHKSEVQVNKGIVVLLALCFASVRGMAGKSTQTLKLLQEVHHGR